MSGTEQKCPLGGGGPDLQTPMRSSGMYSLKGASSQRKHAINVRSPYKNGYVIDKGHFAESMIGHGFSASVSSKSLIGAPLPSHVAWELAHMVLVMSFIMITMSKLNRMSPTGSPGRVPRDVNATSGRPSIQLKESAAEAPQHVWWVHLSPHHLVHEIGADAVQPERPQADAWQS